MTDPLDQPEDVAYVHACNDCGAEVGEEHDDGCDVARCLAFGSQRIQCGPGSRLVPVGHLLGGGVEVIHVFDGHGCGRDVWTGQWPGVAECVEFGWWAVFVPHGNPSWRRVPAGTAGAHPDLNRLAVEAMWDAGRGRWVLPDVTGEFECPDSPGRDSSESPLTMTKAGTDG